MIDVVYSGVHTAFECALAAQEIGLLREFHCSFYDAPWCWGGAASRLFGKERLRNRRIDGLDVKHVRENPWPLLANDLRQRFGGDLESMQMFAGFDKSYAKHLRRSPPSALVTTERCAFESLKVARNLGIRSLHDCPQLHPVALDLLMKEAAERAGMKWDGFSDGPAMIERKINEYDLANHLMVYSDFQKVSFTSQGVSEDKIFVNPLWVDVDFWHPQEKSYSKPVNSPLKLLFVGELSFRKGLPFLFEALKKLDAPVQLMLAGRSTGQFPIPDQVGKAKLKAVGAVTKNRLRELYVESDLMVLPSVADAFGWVAVEAMACGVPVVLTENCGAPVPDPEWRVPALNSTAIASRLQYYLDKPEKLSLDATLSRAFARQFTPKRFRETMRVEYLKLLA